MNIVNDGIWRVSYDTNESILLVSLTDVCLLNAHSDMEYALHTINHVMISPR